MNIALLSHNGNFEGAPIMLSILAKELQNHGHTCTVALAETGLLERRLDKHNIPHTVFHNLFKHPANYLNHYKPDLAIINTILGFRAVEECKKTGVPVIWIIHESDMIFLKRGVTHEHFAMADAIVFPSEYAKAQYKQFDTGNFHVIHNGIAIDHVTAFQNTHTKEDLRKQYNIPFDASVFLSVGTHHALKGFETIVDAGTQLIKKHPERNIHYIIAGSIPSAKEQAEADALLRKVWDSGTRNVMHMYADFPNIYDLFGLSDYYLCASALETFPITILEAMAFQLPIIATNVGGIPEQVSNKTECILVKPKDVSGLSHTMESFMLRPEMAAKMSETALEKCIRMFGNYS